MSRFDMLLFFHILGVVLIAAGAGVGIATGIAMPRTTSVRTIGAMSALATRAEHFAILPGALLTLITGTWLTVDDGQPFQRFDIGETWLWLSYVVWGIAVLLGEGVVARFNHGLHRQARALETQGIETSDELQAAASSRVGPIAGAALTFLLVLFLYLMVFQPGG
ncbi:MAG TPA: DUF2269 family protein [Acidimicrobiia bacterium]